jgi:hypothetical protein
VVLCKTVAWTLLLQATVLSDARYQDVVERVLGDDLVRRRGAVHDRLEAHGSRRLRRVAHDKYAVLLYRPLASPETRPQRPAAVVNITRSAA